MHEGHRRRMYDKLKNNDGLFDHELLEIILFNAYPRGNTNTTAHALLQAFGSLSGVFAADYDSLIAVDGVGENVALYLQCLGECVRRVNPSTSGIAVLKSYEDFRTFAAMRMRGKPYEVLEIYCMGKDGRVKKICPFTSGETGKVVVGTDEIASVLAREKPYGILVAHNHLSGVSEPSTNDDRFTMELQLMCSMNNVCLYDHCIYASDSNVYSYFLSGKIDKIKKDFSFREIVDKQYKSSFGESDDKK